MSTEHCFTAFEWAAFARGNTYTQNEAVIAHMCSSLERFPSSHDKNRWKSLISISFGHAVRGTTLQGPKSCSGEHLQTVKEVLHCILD